MTSPDSQMFTRRRLLASMASAAVAGSAIVSAAPRALAASDGDLTAEAAHGLPLTIVNNSGEFANRSVHLYIVGTKGERQVRVTRRGALAPVKLSDNHDNGFTDYAIPLAARGQTTLRLPFMSGRIYVALGRKLKFKAVMGADGKVALQHPAGWVESDPNYPVLHDFVEFTHKASGMFCNTTMVDMFSVPMMIRLTGAKDHSTGRLRDGGRDRVFHALKNTPDFSRLVVGDRRVIAPSHGLDVGRFPQHYFDAYIDKVWHTYRNKDLVVRTNAGTFTGRVKDHRLTFTGPASVSFAKPSTRDVLFCDGALTAPNDGTTGPVAAVLGAGFNRSTLFSHREQPTTHAAAFYDTPVTNHYAKAIHAATTNGKAYGFAFDDVADWASYIQDTRPRHMHLTLTAF
ncbi:beta-1,3-glucanase family protein [Streptomyces olivochromogenes]|uniref:beta-1,3-glucanase family protein n=1 Tax=Streptomyces olivochromogenes TaxID=1963 RepID=UPI001F2102B2|nr:beta-1,3-glucanase family protein [Streptomyces olivochromogenes]MCF3129225.1 glycosyl hydrolase [Streptomyces olivochromogenes]